MNGHDVSPETLIERAQRGDARSFGALVRRFDPELRVLSHRMLGPSWSEDILQDSYLRAFRAVGRFESGRGSVPGWLYRIVYRACLDELRRLGRERWESSELLDGYAADEALERAANERLDLWTVLGSLTAEDRACLVLVDALGFDYASAGEVLDVPRGTIASRLNRARRLVREALELTEEVENERVPGREHR